MSTSIARGIALFLGAFSFAVSCAGILGGATIDGLWLVDMRFLPDYAAVPLATLSAALLIAWALRPRASRWRRHLTATLTSMVAAIAVRNAGDFYALRDSGAFRPAAAIPLSVVVACAFGLLAIEIARSRKTALSRGNHPIPVPVATVALVLAVLFPVAQVYFFGTTDYRRPADAVVVLGARVYDDGRLSASLDDRVRTAVELYDQGLVSRLVMSGGVGESGIDESVAMRRRAVELGVPSSAILLDGGGVDTDATVRNTTAIFRDQGIERVLAVSQFYHLPRIKLAYRAAGVDVCTVPAMERTPISGTRVSVAREVPGFWLYWARAWVRGLNGTDGVDLAMAPEYSSAHEQFSKPTIFE